MRTLLYILLILIFSSTMNAQCPLGGGVFINEIKTSGGEEYVELVVLPDPTDPTGIVPVDLSGWIFDDNNIDMFSQGTANGHLKFDNSFSNFLPGSIIVLYNSSTPFPGIPSSVPPYLFTIGIQLTIATAGMDGCSSSPNTGNSNYTPCGTMEAKWKTVSMPSSGDFPQVRDPFANFYHGLAYGGVSILEPGVLVSNDDISLDCGSWFDAANYTITTQSPGDFNSPDNQTLITAIRNGNLDCDNIDLACVSVVCPEINDISISAVSACENESFDVTAFEIGFMDNVSNGENDFGVNFLSFPGAVPPVDPYIGGTSIGTVSFASLVGASPNQSAVLTVPANTMTDGIYNICAILDPIPGSINCDPFQCIQVEILDIPEVVLTGNYDFCPGDCNTLDISVVGGTQPYDIDFVISVGSFNYAFDQTSYDLNNQIIICYDGLFPGFDAATNTVNIPTIITGTGSIEVVDVLSNNGCHADIDNTQNSWTITLLSKPDSFFPTDYELCDDDTDGYMTFDLTTKDLDINGGSGEEVRYFEDNTLLVPIVPASSYFSDSKTVYAVVVNSDGCFSNAVDLELIVKPIGDVVVDFFCNSSGDKLCEYCTDGSVSIDINFSFGTNDAYSIEMEYGNAANGYTLFTVSNVYDGDVFPFTISENTTFHLLSVTLFGACPDVTDLAADVEVLLITGPKLNMDLFQNGCDSVILAAIDGLYLTGGESYYTQSGGMGTAIAPGTVYYTSTTLYVYDELGLCNDEVQVEISIVDQVTFDPISDVDDCGFYILPSITGLNLTGDQNYYTGPNGSGTKYEVGDTIFTSDHLYVYDPIDCLTGEEDFEITISSGPVITGPGDTLVCDIFILKDVEGVNLNDMVIYNTMIDALGDTLKVGDTIFTAQKIYIYAAGTCTAQDSFSVMMGTGSNVGNDTTLVICEGDPTLVDLWASLGEDVDTAGVWTDFFSSGVDLSDSTSIDFSGVTKGTYPFTYQLLDTTCGVPISLVRVIISGNPEAGNSLNVNLCQSDMMLHNLMNEISMVDTGGVWSQDPPGIFDLSDITQVIYGVAPPGGPYKIKYLIDLGGACLADSAIITLNVQEQSYAGRDSMITVCVGTIVDLNDMIEGESSVGTLLDDDSTGNLSGTIFNTAGMTSGVYHFTHFIVGVAPCTNDESILTVEVVDGLTAGLDNNTSLCVGETVDLSTLLIGADSGGSFTDDDGSGFLTGNSILVTNSNQPSIHFTYTVGGGDCSESTAVITINISSELEIGMYIDNDVLCDGECGEIVIDLIGNAPFDVKVQVLKNKTSVFNITKTTGSNKIRYQICNADTIKAGSDSIFIKDDWNWEFKILSYSDLNCMGDTSNIASIFVLSLEDEYINIDTTSCNPVVIEGITFDQNHTSDHIEVDDPLACKKIYDIVYHYFEPEFGDTITHPLCPEDKGTYSLTNLLGDPSDYTLVIDQVMLSIPSLPFTFDIPSGMHEVYVIQNDGCESLVKNFTIDDADDFNFTPRLDSLNRTQVQFFGEVDISDYTIKWSPNDSLDCTSCLDPIINLGAVPMTYELEIRYSLNCVYYYTLHVPAIQEEPEEPEEPEPPIEINTIYIPNSFNPDDSHFYVTTKDEVVLEVFEIYDRWGNRLYSEKDMGTNSSLGWDGLYKGQEVQPGVYVYVIKLVLNGKDPITKVGSLTLLR